MTKDQIFSNVYYDLENGFGSVRETYNKAKRQNQEITIDDVVKFLRKQPNKQIKAPRGSNSFIAPFSRFEYQIDVIFMTPLASKPNPENRIKVKQGEPREALLVIDIF